VVLFIAAEWYEGSGGAAQHISHVAPKNPEGMFSLLVEKKPLMDVRHASGFYQLTIDEKCQYGQKNGQGDMRFVVYHDKGRKPYQVRPTA